MCFKTTHAKMNNTALPSHQSGVGHHQTRDPLRASLHGGCGMSLMNVNAAPGHGYHHTNDHNGNNITPDIPDGHRGLFKAANSILISYGLSINDEQRESEKKEEEKFRRNMRGFAYRVICNGPLFFAIAMYIIVTAVIIHVQAIRESQLMEWLSASNSGMAFLSAFVGFILVFRTQICYNRWWEGRCLWGALIFATINLAQQGQGSFTEKENFRRLCCLIVCFSIACKNQLYGLSIEADGDYLLSRGLMDRTEFEMVVKRQGWQPYYFLGALREIIDVDLRMSGQQAKSNTNIYSFKGSTTDSQLLMMDLTLNQMATNIGGLIRVKATGLPLGYDTIFYGIFLVYFIVTTLSWVVLLQWYTPILMSLLHLVVRSITELGTCLEDPFGDDMTDLPLDKFCQAIEMQIAAVFNDTFPSNTSYVDAWPTQKVSINKAVAVNDTSNSTATTPIAIDTMPVMPEETDDVESSDHSNILSGEDEV